MKSMSILAVASEIYPIWAPGIWLDRIPRNTTSTRESQRSNSYLAVALLDNDLAHLVRINLAKHVIHDASAPIACYHQILENAPENTKHRGNKCYFILGKECQFSKCASQPDGRQPTDQDGRSHALGRRHCKINGIGNARQE